MPEIHLVISITKWLSREVGVQTSITKFRLAILILLSAMTSRLQTSIIFNHLENNKSLLKLFGYSSNFKDAKPEVGDKVDWLRIGRCSLL